MKNLYSKLSKLQAIARALAPDANGKTGAANYPYISGAKLLSVVRPAMDELHLALLQEIKEITNTPIRYNTSKGEKLEMFTTIHLLFTWVDTESCETLALDFYANGMNAFDKGLGSALTYAERYFLLKNLHIATDEDDIDALIKEEAITPATAAATTDKPAPVEEKPAKKLFSPEDTPKAWKSAIDKYTAGSLTKNDIEKKYDVTPENWAKFLDVVSLNLGTTDDLPE